MVREPQVTVVIPTRNRRELLPRALRSALCQRGVQVEVIVVDEASDDGTGEYIAGLGDERVSAIRHEQPLGVARARNAGLDGARAEWVAFLDDDDFWAPEKLAAQLEALAGAPEAGWSCVGAAIVDERLRVMTGMRAPARASLPDALLAANVIPGGGSGVVARTDLVRELSGFDPQLKVLADWDLWTRLALRAPLAPVDRPLVAYLQHAGGMSRDGADIREELGRIERKHRDVRAERGVGLPSDIWLMWTADMQRLGGRRWSPTAAYLRLAVRRRGGRALAKAFLTAAWPGWVRARSLWGLYKLPDGWKHDVARWLDEVKRQSAASR